MKGQRSIGSLAATAARWLLGLVVVGVVAFGVYTWGEPRSQRAAPHAQSVPVRGPDQVPMPTGAIPGWRQVFADSFDGRTLDRSKWRVYSGQPSGDPAGWFEPSHVKVSHGMLVMSAFVDPAAGGRWASGGISSSPGLVQTYGKYLVRFRFDPGEGIGHALLLATADGSWPPEIDFSEDNGSGRDSTLTTLHYGSSDHRISRHIKVDLTQWHTLGLEWTRGQLVYTLDGRNWATVTSSHVPTVPMVLDLQTQAWPCFGTWGRCPDATTPRAVRMYVDWVVAYAPADARG